MNLTALGYDLTTQTEPDPDQIISLAVGDAATPGQPTPEPVTLRVGDTARLRAGVIVDRNGHPVPDGTPVRFYFQYDGEAAPTIQEGKTSNGVALTEFVLSKVGRLLIHATSEPALDSIGLQITISESGAIVATVAPTPTPTPTRIPTLTPTRQSDADRNADSGAAGVGDFPDAQNSKRTVGRVAPDFDGDCAAERRRLLADPSAAE